MALMKKDNMVEYRWKIKYPDKRDSQTGPWVVGKRATMKDFFSKRMCQFRTGLHIDHRFERNHLPGQESTK